MEPAIVNINGISLYLDFNVDDGIVCNDSGIMVEIKYLSHSEVLRQFSEIGLPDDFVQCIDNNHINNMRLYSYDGSNSLLVRGSSRNYKFAYMVNTSFMSMNGGEIIVGAFKTVNEAYSHLIDFVPKIRQIGDGMYASSAKFAFRIRESIPVLLTIIWHDEEIRTTSSTRSSRRSNKYVDVEYCLPLDVISQGCFKPYLNTEDIFMLATSRNFIGNSFFNNGVKFAITNDGKLKINTSFQLSNMLDDLNYYFGKACQNLSHFKVIRYFDSFCDVLYWVSKFGQCFEPNTIDNFSFLVHDNRVYFVIVPFRGVWWLIALSDILQIISNAVEIVSNFFNTPSNLISEVLMRQTNGPYNEPYEPFNNDLEFNSCPDSIIGLDGPYDEPYVSFNDDFNEPFDSCLSLFNNI